MAGMVTTVSPGFLLLAACLFFLGGGGALTAFFSAALTHELGHLLMIYLMGAVVKDIRLTAAGPVIEYCGMLTPRQEMGILAAGPAAGLLFACGCFWADTAYFEYAGAVALLATVFNLLPVVPMDGGRLLQLLLEEVMPEKGVSVILRICGNICALGVVFTGICVGSAAAAAIGIWMALLANVPVLR